MYKWTNNNQMKDRKTVPLSHLSLKFCLKVYSSLELGCFKYKIWIVTYAYFDIQLLMHRDTVRL